MVKRTEGEGVVGGGGVNGVSGLCGPTQTRTQALEVRQTRSEVVMLCVAHIGSSSKLQQLAALTKVLEGGLAPLPPVALNLGHALIPVGGTVCHRAAVRCACRLSPPSTPQSVHTLSVAGRGCMPTRQIVCSLAIVRAAPARNLELLGHRVEPELLASPGMPALVWVLQEGRTAGVGAVVQA